MCVWVLLCRQPTPGCDGAWAGAVPAPCACPGSVSVCGGNTGPAHSSATLLGQGCCHRTCSSLPWCPNSPASISPALRGASPGHQEQQVSLHCQCLTAHRPRSCCPSLFETHSLLREHQTKPDKGSVCIVTPSQRERNTKTQDI